MFYLNFLFWEKSSQYRQLFLGSCFIVSFKQMLILRSYLSYRVKHFCKIIHKNMFTKWSISVKEICFLVKLVWDLLQFIHIEINKTWSSFDKLSFAERILIENNLPKTILLNFFILLNNINDIALKTPY